VYLTLFPRRFAALLSFFVGSAGSVSIVGSMVGRGTSPSACYVCFDDGPSSPFDPLDGVSEDGGEDGVIFETRVSKGVKEMGVREAAEEAVREAMGEMEGLEAEIYGNVMPSLRDVGKTASGKFVPGPPSTPPAIPLMKIDSSVPPPPPTGRGGGRRRGGGGEGENYSEGPSDSPDSLRGKHQTGEHVGHDSPPSDGPPASPNQPSASIFTRKDMLLARVASSRKGMKEFSSSNLVHSYDLSSDFMSALVEQLRDTYGEGMELDDPTILGGEVWRKRGFKVEEEGESNGRIKPKDAVERVLEDSKVMGLFEVFLKKEFAGESTDFLKDVKAWEVGREMRGKEEVLAKAKEIFKKYIKEGGDEQVNLPQALVKKVQGRIKDLETGKGGWEGIFDECKDEIVEMLASDKITRFLDWKEVRGRKEVFEKCVRMEAKIEKEARKKKKKKDEEREDENGGGAEEGNAKAKAKEETEKDEGLNLSRLFASQIGIVCPYDNDVLKVMDVGCENKSGFLRKVKGLDKTVGKENYKIGVLYVGEGQTNQKDILKNCYGSREYER